MSQSNNSPDNEFKDYTVREDGKILLHRGDTADLAARTWTCEKSYEAILIYNWEIMRRHYFACYALGEIPSSGTEYLCYKAYDDLVAEAKGLPSTGDLVDRCCSIANVTLIPMERLLHIRRLKEFFAIPIDLI